MHPKRRRLLVNFPNETILILLRSSRHSVQSCGGCFIHWCQNQISQYILTNRWFMNKERWYISTPVVENWNTSCVSHELGTKRNLVSRQEVELQTFSFTVRCSTTEVVRQLVAELGHIWDIFHLCDYLLKRWQN